METIWSDGLLRRTSSMNKGFSVEWGDLPRDLDRLQEATIEKDSKRITTRTHVTGQVGSVFQAAGVALPPNIREQAA